MSAPPIDLVLGLLKGARRYGQGWVARCPAHEDHDPSLSVKEGVDGRVLLKCRADCSTESILAAIGLTWSDLFADSGVRSGGPDPLNFAPKDSDIPRPILATYRYHDEQGGLLYSVGRTAEKDFPTWQPEGRGGYRWGLSGVRRVLYRLPDVLRAVENGDMVYICEGEKDADALQAAGVVATSNLGGVGKWRPHDSEILRGANVVVVRDKDEPGRKHADAVAASLAPLTASVRVVEAAVGKDASDHLAAGKTLEEFVNVDVGTARVSLPPSDAATAQPEAAPAGHAGKGGTPTRARHLSRYPGAWCMEKNCAQVIIMGPHGRPRWRPSAPKPPEWEWVGTMKHFPVRASNSFCGLSSDAFLALAFQHAKYVRQGAPDSGEAAFTTRELGEAIGRRKPLSTTGAARILDELLAGSFEGTLSRYDGEATRGTLTVIQWYVIYADGLCRVCLSDLVAENLRNDFSAYLDHDTMRALMRADSAAMRIWVYAEAQNLKNSTFAKKGLPVCIFAQPWTDKNKTLTVNVMLSLAKWDEKRVLERIHAAVDCVNATDAKYEMHVDKDKSWRVVLKRGDLGARQDEIHSALSSEPSTDCPTAGSPELSTD